MDFFLDDVDHPFEEDLALDESDCSSDSFSYLGDASYLRHQIILIVINVIFFFLFFQKIID